MGKPVKAQETRAFCTTQNQGAPRGGAEGKSLHHRTAFLPRP